MPSHWNARCSPPPKRPRASRMPLPCSDLYLRLIPVKVKGRRIRRTTTSLAAVAMPGAMSSRTARATIQLPDQRNSVAARTSQTAKGETRLITHANLNFMPQISAGGHALEVQWIDGSEPVLVFLHEGLGSIPQWRDFPAKVAHATGCRALVYDRYGYGKSDVLKEDRVGVDFMHREALDSLPGLLSKFKIENPVLVGHSDGASIALIHAGAGHAVRGVAVLAP